MAAPDLERHGVHQVYDRIAVAFDATRFAHWGAVRRYLEALPAGAWVLDHGCGNGKYATLRPDLVYIGHDRCAPLVALAAGAAGAAGAARTAQGSPDFLHVDGLMLPYRNQMFDAVICVAVFHHLSTEDRRRRWADEMHRVVRPGGSALITVWARSQSHRRAATWRPGEAPGDTWIPWKTPEGHSVAERYYHLFEREELAAYFPAPAWRVHSFEWECDNWVLHVQRGTSQPK